MNVITNWRYRDLEDLLDKYLSSEAADYYHSLKAVVNIAKKAIEEAKVTGGLTGELEKELSEWE